MMESILQEDIPYRVVEYLESDGEAYIDTGICPADISPVLEVEMYKKNLSSIYYVIGSDGSGNTRFSIGIVRSTSIEVRVGDYRQVTNKDERFYRIKLNSITGQCHIDDALVYTGSKNAANNTYPILLFTSSTSTGTVRAIAKGVGIARFRLLDGSRLVADYYPVDVDGVGYYYDKVTKTLHGNAAPSGAFIIGGGNWLIINTLCCPQEERRAA